jgi:hypothetical protein
VRRVRWTLVALLAVSTVRFALGVIAESDRREVDGDLVTLEYLDHP